MKYISTRANFKPVSSAAAIRMGMVPAGGLFVPEEIPVFDLQKIAEMATMSYQQIALQVLGSFLNDYTEKELKEAIDSAYTSKNFDHPDISPLIELASDTYLLELWHGPTAAFKDMALQLMPHLLVKAVAKGGQDKEILILVATSGDTGKAALEGFRNIPGIKIIVFYPERGVSKLQEVQMKTTEGDNTAVVAVEGNFDDCQNRVKEIFSDQKFNKFIAKKGYQFSSANSINWGRLVPQIVYYFAAYASLIAKGVISTGDKINIVVPTGNFGNILSGYYAHRMGLPVNRLICASNDNNILTDFLNSGIYDIKRKFKKTISPSMDILISSNLERFLFEITGHDGDLINHWYQQLREEDEFKIESDLRTRVNEIMKGDYADEKETRQTIADVFEEYNYLLDPHTAVGVKVYQKVKSNSQIPAIIASTASPFKFTSAVLTSLQANQSINDEYEMLRELEEISGREIHRALSNLDTEPIRHNRNCGNDAIRAEIREILGDFKDDA